MHPLEAARLKALKGDPAPAPEPPSPEPAATAATHDELADADREALAGSIADLEEYLDCVWDESDRNFLKAMRTAEVAARNRVGAVKAIDDAIKAIA